MIVCKFGGTSVQDAEAITRLLRIVESRRDERPLVVVSAFAGVTDQLLELVPLVERGALTDAVAAIERIVARHREVGRGLPGGGTLLPSIEMDARVLAQTLRGQAGRPLGAAERDHVVAHGELWSSRVVSAAMAGAGLPAEWVDARDVMATDAHFGRATPDAGEIAARAAARLAPLLERGAIPVTQGFIGRAPDGRTSTLGRGGSDFTASLLGAALGAARVEIWTDVTGIMTADPRLVPAARTLAAASYDEAAELATFGAKVLHPATQLPLVERGIPIVVLNARRPELPGTRIEPSARLERVGDSPVRAITCKKGIVVVNVRTARMLGAYGYLRRIFEVFERHETPVDVLASSEVSVSLTIEDRARLDPIVADLADHGDVWVDEGRAIVAVVGLGLRGTPGIAARVFTAVQPANVELISQGSSAINLTFVVREAEAADVVRRLHREFFGEA